MAQSKSELMDEISERIDEYYDPACMYDSMAQNEDCVLTQEEEDYVDALAAALSQL